MGDARAVSEEKTASPLSWTRNALAEGWRSLRTVYYANTLAWRALKSGALVFLGFFLWSASNLLLSYQPTWTFLRYSMAYGFVLIAYGPFHHAVVIPLSIRLRRRPDDWSRVGRNLPNASLVVFLLLVVALGTAPPAVMAFDFESALESGGLDVNPDLACTKAYHGGQAHVHCHLTESTGIDSVVVESGGKQVTVDEEPPFEFTIREDQMETVVGQKQFQVVLEDENGDTIRRYTRPLRTIPEGKLSPARPDRS